MGRRDHRQYDDGGYDGPPALRVVEFSRGVAAQACGRLLAGLGHDVLKCEPRGGDPTRTQWPVDEYGRGCGFSALNAAKRSAVVDVGTSRGREKLDGLLQGADLLISDVGPTQAEVAGLTAEGIRRNWPELVAVSITAAGIADPRSDYVSDSMLAECHGGLAAMIGEPDGSPLSLGGEQSAHAAAFAGFFGGMLALQRRERGGHGDVVDVALCDVAAYIDWKSDIEVSCAATAPTRTGATAGMWRIVRAADGWVGVIFQEDQWDALIELVTGVTSGGGPEGRAGATRDPEGWWPLVEKWAADLPKRTIYERAQALGLAFGFSADLYDLFQDRQYRSRGFLAEPGNGALPGTPVHAERLPWRSGAAPELGDGDAFVSRGRQRSRDTAAPEVVRTTAAAPLAGVTVLDLGTITAGAATGRLLADYGATVIKVESAGHPDPFRQWPVAGKAPSGYGRKVSAMFESNNAGKLSVVLDLKSPADREELHRMAAGADIVIENFTVGVTRRLGADFESLRAINPRLIYLSLSSQGQGGPEATRRSYGSTLDLLSGLASVTGYPDGRPMWSSAEVNYPDQAASLFGAGLVTYCLSRGVRGVHLDVAQRELVSWTLADRFVEYGATGMLPTRTGNRRPGSVPHDVYPCAGEDRWIGIACRGGAERDALASLVAPTRLAGKPERWWCDHQWYVDELVATWTRARSRQECVRALGEAGVPCAPVLAAAERASEPRFTERRVFLGEGLSRRKGFPLLMHDYQPPDPAPAPGLGRDQEAVLRDTRLATTGSHGAGTGPTCQQKGTV